MSPPALPPVPADGGGYGYAPTSPAVIGQWHEGSPGAPAPIPENGVGGDRDESTASAPAMDNGGVRWCAVRDQLEECQFFVGVIDQLTGYTWKW